MLRHLFTLTWLMTVKNNEIVAHETANGDELDGDEKYINAGIALLCVLIGGIAAGLTMGLLSIDPLMLRIKLRSGTNLEKSYAKKILPVVSNHHRLLVTLLLLNSVANETLPLFLDKLFPGYVAIIVSVTFVLVFGEIIPSALFTGPKQMEIAAFMSPVVKFVLFMFAPIALPISSVLDSLLGHEDGVTMFKRVELNALVKIQHEESKKHTTQEDSILYDEVKLIEGALSMSTKTVKDAYIKLEEVFTVEASTVLDEHAMETIYISGHSRVPVYEKSSENPTSTVKIVGILLTKHLVVVNANEKRIVNSLPLQIPICVAESTPIMCLLNAFISERGTGKGEKKGHCALVCANPTSASLALNERKPIPHEAGVKGIITLEDVIEELIQKEIFDEHDRSAVMTHNLSRKVFSRWKSFTNRRRVRRGELPTLGTTYSQREVLNSASTIPKSTSEKTSILLCPLGDHESYSSVC